MLSTSVDQCGVMALNVGRLGTSTSAEDALYARYTACVCPQ